MILARKKHKYQILWVAVSRGDVAGLLFHFLAKDLDFSTATYTVPHRDWSPVLSSLWNRGWSRIWVIIENNRSLCLQGQNDVDMSGDCLHRRCPPLPTSHSSITQQCHRPPHQQCALRSFLETGFPASPCQDLETLSPSRRKGRICIHPQRASTGERYVMASWASAVARASHMQQLSCSQDLAEVPHDALNTPYNLNTPEHAVQHRHSQGSSAPWQTSSISGHNVNHYLTVLHRRGAHLCHIFQDFRGKSLSRPCSLCLNSTQILT